MKKRKDVDSNESKFQHGPYFRGEGFTCLSDEEVTREFTAHLSIGEMAVFRGLSTKAWDERNLVTQAAASFIAKRVKIGARTVERHLANLRDKGFILLVIPDFEHGHSYLIEPVLLWSSKWHELENIRRTSIIREGKIVSRPRQNGGAKHSPAILAEEVRQNGGACDASVGLRPRQNGGQSRSRSSDPNGAPSHTPNQSAGGVEVTPSEGKKRSPKGQDHTSGEKGVVLPADKIETVSKKLEAALNGESYIEKKKKRHTEIVLLGKACLSGEITEAEYQAKMKALNSSDGKPTFFVEPQSKKERKSRLVDGNVQV